MITMTLNLTRDEKFMTWQAIDYDLSTNIPNRLRCHLLTIHGMVYVRTSASGKHVHIIYQSETRCTICDSFSDSNFVDIQDLGKPLILWSTKTYRNEIPGITIHRRAGPWQKLWY